MIGCMIESSISVAAAVHLAVAKSDVITKVDLDGPSLGQFESVSGGVHFNESGDQHQRRAGAGHHRSARAGDAGLISALRLTLRATDVGFGHYFSFAKRKVTKRSAPPAASRCYAPVPALLGPSRDGAGTRYAQTPAPLRPRRTRGARLATRRNSTSNATAAPSRSTPRVEALVFALPRNPFAAGTRAMCPRSGGWGLRGCPPHGCGGQAYTDVLAASPAIPPPDPPHNSLYAATATPLQTPGHPACRPC